MTITSRAAVPEPALQCSLCGGNQERILSGVEDFETRESFSIFRCRQCGIEQTVPVPADLAHYYSSQYHGGRHGFTARHCAHRRLRWINRFRTQGGNKLLDVGCGEGTFLLQAQASGWQVAGTEMNPAPASACGLEVRSSLDDVAALAPFHCITLWHSLEHMRDPREVLSQSHRLLAPNGTLWIAVPNARGWQAGIFGAHWLHRDVPRHLYHFGPASLRELLKSVGFELLKSWHQEFEYDLLGWSQSALNKISSPPNLFFSAITGRQVKVGAISKFANVAAGAAFSAMAVPLVPLSACFGQGGTLVVAARKKAVAVPSAKIPE
jgi:2-polyprenyl-3-methyl-5-hydroxy-6-metoxy-1,4-benzoquinol methylase